MGQRARVIVAPPVKQMYATSGCHATARTSAVWPCSTARQEPVLTSLRGGHRMGQHVFRLASKIGNRSRCSLSALHTSQPGPAASNYWGSPFLLALSPDPRSPVVGAAEQ